MKQYIDQDEVDRQYGYLVAKKYSQYEIALAMTRWAEARTRENLYEKTYLERFMERLGMGR